MCDGEHQETREIRSGKRDIHSPGMTGESATNMPDGRIRQHIRSGIVKDILTNSASHPHGIKVRLVDGQVGRVQKIEE